jgi:hypothetical protein
MYFATFYGKQETLHLNKILLASARPTIQGVSQMLGQTSRVSSSHKNKKKYFIYTYVWQLGGF